MHDCINSTEEQFGYADDNQIDYLKNMNEQDSVLSFLTLKNCIQRVTIYKRKPNIGS